MALTAATAETAKEIANQLIAKGAERQKSYGIKLPEGVYPATVGADLTEFKENEVYPLVDYKKGEKLYFMQLLSVVLEFQGKTNYLNVQIDDCEVGKWNVGEPVSIEVKEDKTKTLRASITTKTPVLNDADLSETPEKELERLQTEILALKGVANKVARNAMQARIDELEELVAA